MMTRCVVLLSASVALFGQEKLSLQLANLSEPIHLQEAATVVRSIGEIRELRLDAGARTIHLEGTAAQAATAQWLLGRLDITEGSAAPAIERFEMPGTPDGHVRVLRSVRVSGPASLQELTTMIRAIGEIQRGFSFTRGNVMVFRGTATEAALAEWLFERIEQAPTGPAVSEPYLFGAAQENAVRVLFLKPETAPGDLQQEAKRIREAAQLRRVFAYPGVRAIAIRGTAAQVDDAVR